MSGWNSEMIAGDRRKLAEANFAGASRDQLLDRIVALEVSLTKLSYSLNELDIEPSHRGRAFMTSKLFPLRNDEGEILIFDKESREMVPTIISEDTMHSIDYALDDSVDVVDGAKLSDNLPILSVYQSAMCATIIGGSIFMGDVREAARLLWSQPDAPDPEAQNG